MSATAPIHIFFSEKRQKAFLKSFFTDNYDRCIRIPMKKESRSLNLSNSAAVIVYEALRQLDFPGLSTEGKLTQY